MRRGEELNTGRDVKEAVTHINALWRYMCVSEFKDAYAGYFDISKINSTPRSYLIPFQYSMENMRSALFVSCIWFSLAHYYNLIVNRLCQMHKMKAGNQWSSSYHGSFRTTCFAHPELSHALRLIGHLKDDHIQPLLFNRNILAMCVASPPPPPLYQEKIQSVICFGSAFCFSWWTEWKLLLTMV